MDLDTFTGVSWRAKKNVKRCSGDVNENIFSRIGLRMFEKIDNVKCNKDVANGILISSESVIDQPLRG